MAVAARRVAVVGGGITGLSTAYHLLRTSNGHPVEVTVGARTFRANPKGPLYVNLRVDSDVVVGEEVVARTYRLRNVTYVVFQPTDEEPEADPEGPWAAMADVPSGPLADDSLVDAKQNLSEAVENLMGVLANPDFRGAIGSTDRANLAKYLTIAKLRLENAIAMVRSGDGR